MKNKLFILLFMGIALISLTSGASELVFKQNDLVNYSFVCLTANNSYCGSGVNCNININAPNGINIVNNGSMTFTPTSFNYVFPTSDIGKYNWLILCQDGTNAISEGDYTVNLTGNLFDNLWMNFIIVFLLTIVAVIVSLYSGNKSRFEENQIFYYLSAFLLFAIGIYVIINGFGGYKNLLSQAFGYVTWGVALYFLTKPWFYGKYWSF